MKKKILTIILTGIIMLGIVGCSKQQNGLDVGKKSNIKITENDVSLSIKEGTLTNTGATIVLKNKSDKVFQYGNPYEIEIKRDGKWHKINVEMFFTMPAFWLNPQEIKEFELNWESGYGKLACGTYRIIKDISYEKEDDTYDKFYIAAEFTI